jgi:hypothetical protein
MSKDGVQASLNIRWMKARWVSPAKFDMARQWLSLEGFKDAFTAGRKAPNELLRVYKEREVRGRAVAARRRANIFKSVWDGEGRKEKITKEIRFRLLKMFQTPPCHISF